MSTDPSLSSTRSWIANLENRVEDMQFYLARTLEWCEENEVYSDKTIFVCSVMTLVWVSYLRCETISRKELFEILNIQGWNDLEEDAIFEFNPKYATLELEQLLEEIVSSFY